MAGLVWALVPVVLLVIKTRPSDMGLLPDGRAAPRQAAQAQPLAGGEGLTARTALATSAFWVMALSFVTHGFSEVGILQNQVPFLEDSGFPVATAAGVLGVVGLFSTIGKFGFGLLCDRMAARYVCAIGLGLQVVGAFILMNIGPTSPMVMLWIYAIIMGLGVGSWLPSMSMLVSTNFGLASYGAIFGMIGFSQSLGAATGPVAIGYMYDTMGTYQWAFVSLLSSYAVSTLTVLMVRRPSAFADIMAQKARLEATSGR
jgi:MFS family permease